MLRALVAAPVVDPQLEAHERKLRLFEEIDEMLSSSESPDGVRLALQAGIGHEREYIDFWSRLRHGELGRSEGSEIRIDERTGFPVVRLETTISTESVRSLDEEG